MANSDVLGSNVQWREAQSVPEDSSQKISISTNQDHIREDAKEVSRAGPMGIFFKVWSLVKVTKSRHRLKRQNSEAIAGQFRYVANPTESETKNSTNARKLSNHQQHNWAVLNQRQVPRGIHNRRASQPSTAVCAQTEFISYEQADEGRTLFRAVKTNFSGQSKSRGRRAILTGADNATASSSSGMGSTTSSTVLTANLAGDKNNQVLLSNASSIMYQSKSDLASKLLHTNRNTSLTTRQSQYFDPASKEQLSSVEVAHCPGPNFMLRSDKRSLSSKLQKSRLEQLSNEMECSEGIEQSQSLVEDIRQSKKLTSESKSLTKKNIPLETRYTKADLVKSRDRLHHSKETLSGEDGDEDSSSSVEEVASYVDDEINANIVSQQSATESKRSKSLFEANKDHRSDRVWRTTVQADDDSDLNDIYSTPNDSIQSMPNSGLGDLKHSNQHRLNSSDSSSDGDAHTIAPDVSQSESKYLDSQKDKSLNDASYVNLSAGRMPKSLSANYFGLNPPVHKFANENENYNTNAQETNLTGLRQKNVENFTQKSSELQKRDADFTDTSRIGNVQDQFDKSKFFISSSSSEESTSAVPVEADIQDYCRLGTILTSKCEQPIISKTALHRHPSLIVPLIQPSTRELSVSSSPWCGEQFKQHQEGCTQLGSETKRPYNSVAINPLFESAAASDEMSAIRLMDAASVPQKVNSGLCKHLGNKAQITDFNYHNSTKTSINKSTSLFTMSDQLKDTSRLPTNNYQLIERTPSSKFISPSNSQRTLTSFVGSTGEKLMSHRCGVTNSISLHEKLGNISETKVNKSDQIPKSLSKILCLNRLAEYDSECIKEEPYSISDEDEKTINEHKLISLLLKPLGTRDEVGNTALMLAVRCRNVIALEHLLRLEINIDEVNDEGLNALDLVTAMRPTNIPLKMMKLLTSSKIDIDQIQSKSGTRLIDRLITKHSTLKCDKLPFIDILLDNGARLGSMAWSAARGKYDIQLRLLRKLCQDGYHLTQVQSIEAAVFRFEYALKRLAELENQVNFKIGQFADIGFQRDKLLKEILLIKYQAYLGLSRCERKRKFYKRALDFAHMSILTDSTLYEGYFAKAHILKDMGDLNQADYTINQAKSLVEKSIDVVKDQLMSLDKRAEDIFFCRPFCVRDPNPARRLDSIRLEMENDLDYLFEARRHVNRLKLSILNCNSN